MLSREAAWRLELASAALTVGAVHALQGVELASAVVTVGAVHALQGVELASAVVTVGAVHALQGRGRMVEQQRHCTRWLQQVARAHRRAAGSPACPRCCQFQTFVKSLIKNFKALKSGR